MDMEDPKGLFPLWLLGWISLVSWAHPQTACISSNYSLFRGRQTTKGSLLLQQTTLNDCKRYCDSKSWCQGVEFNIRQKRCQVFTQVGYTKRDMCCVMAVKRCGTSLYGERDQYGRTRESVANKRTTLVSYYFQQRPHDSNQGSHASNQGSNGSNQGSNGSNQGSHSSNQGSRVSSNQGSYGSNQGSQSSNQGSSRGRYSNPGSIFQWSYPNQRQQQPQQQQQHNQQQQNQQQRQQGYYQQNRPQQGGSQTIPQRTRYHITFRQRPDTNISPYAKSNRYKTYRIYTPPPVRTTAPPTPVGTPPPRVTRYSSIFMGVPRSEIEQAKSSALERIRWLLIAQEKGTTTPASSRGRNRGRGQGRKTPRTRRPRPITIRPIVTSTKLAATTTPPSTPPTTPPPTTPPTTTYRYTPSEPPKSPILTPPPTTKQPGKTKNYSDVLSQFYGVTKRYTPPIGKMATTTITTTTTTLEPGIPDSGICPDPFQRVDHTYVKGGQIAAGVNDIESCKQVCLDDEECVAVDFSQLGNVCVKHGPEDMVEGYTRQHRQCCHHFHKTTCEDMRCYEHPELDLVNYPDRNAENIRLGSGQKLEGLEAPVCDGVCRVLEHIRLAEDGVTLLERTLERGCINGITMPEGQLCRTNKVVLDNGDCLFDMECRCEKDRCNALGPSPLLGMMIYLPLDGDTLDYSGNKHHGKDVGLQYDAYARKMGMSGYFDGSSHISVQSVRGFLPGHVSGALNKRTPSLTLMLWFKRSSTSKDGRSCLFSNGIIEVASNKVRDKHNISLSVILEDGVGYHTEGEIPDASDWVFVAGRLILGETPDGAELQLFLSDEQLDAEQPANLLKLPPVPVMQSMFPLFIGRHPLHGHYFHGFMDEIFVFSDALDKHQIQAIRDLTKPWEDGETTTVDTVSTSTDSMDTSTQEETTISDETTTVTMETTLGDLLTTDSELTTSGPDEMTTESEISTKADVTTMKTDVTTTTEDYYNTPLMV